MATLRPALFGYAVYFVLNNKAEYQLKIIR